MATIFHASRHFVLFSIRFDRAVIDLLISFNYKVNDFCAPPRAAAAARSCQRSKKKLMKRLIGLLINAGAAPLLRPAPSASSPIERAVAAAMAKPADE